MENKFKAGDYVYFPYKSTQIFQLIVHSDPLFPLRLKDPINNETHTFTTEGKFYSAFDVPSLVKATKENCQKLSELYGVEFEKPVSFLDKLLNQKSKVLCLVYFEKPDELPQEVWEVTKRTVVTLVVSKTQNTGSYISIEGRTLNTEYIYPIAINELGKITYLD